MTEIISEQLKYLLSTYEWVISLLTIVITILVIHTSNSPRGGVGPGLNAAYLDLVPLAYEAIRNTTNAKPESLITLMVRNPAPTTFILLALAIAVWPASYLDAKRLWNKHQGELSETQKYLIAKYGSADRYVAGIGRCWWQPRHLFYVTGCNVAGASCTISMTWLAWMLGEDFTAFVGTEPSLMKLLGLMFSFAMLVVLIDLEKKQNDNQVVVAEKGQDQKGGGESWQSGVSLTQIDTTRENPDTYLLDRWHVIFNTIHLLVTIVYLLACGGYILLYLVNHFQMVHINLGYFALALTTLLFEWFAAASPMAREYHAGAIDLWEVITAITLLLTLLFSLLFRITPSMLVCTTLTIMLMGGAIWNIKVPVQDKDRRMPLIPTLFIVLLYIIVAYSLMLR